MKCLISYISRTGTTEEIARRIGEILEARGAEVDVEPIASVADLKGYDRLILGSPLNGMRVLPEFNAFLSEKVVGSGLPVDIFMVSYLFEHGRKGWKKTIQKDRERLRTLPGASSVEIFGGRLQSQLPGFARLIFGTSRDLPLDLRDWGKIEAWAASLADNTAPAKG